MLQEVNGGEYYTYNEGTLSFTYYPVTGLVRGATADSTYRSIEHFARIGFEINWILCNIGRLTIYVKTPDHLSEEESLELISVSRESLFAAEKEDKKSLREKTIAGNIDNNTGKVLSEHTLKDQIRALKNDTKYSREDVADWFNTFNIESIRTDYPLIVASTRSKKVISDQAKRYLWILFEQGKLIKLTPEEVAAKLKKYSGVSDKT